ncbi:MAG: hypothetical protein KC592_07240 [Nitrospira sp.]|nr:hypothetical protein [Nitrospira sp.]HNP27858.1 hypothetical protein [Nitrospirales bacterium]
MRFLLLGHRLNGTDTQKHTDQEKDSFVRFYSDSLRHENMVVLPVRGQQAHGPHEPLRQKKVDQHSMS